MFFLNNILQLNIYLIVKQVFEASYLIASNTGHSLLIYQLQIAINRSI